MSFPTFEPTCLDFDLRLTNQTSTPSETGGNVEVCLGGVFYVISVMKAGMSMMPK